MKQPDGTFHSTAGPTGFTGRLPAARLRLVGLTLTALLGSVLVIWVSRTTWQRVDSLQTQVTGLNADNFYLGVRMRSDVQRLNDMLLRYRLRGDTNDAEAFRADSQIFRQWLDQNSTNAITPIESAFFGQVQTAYADYLADTTEVLDSSRGRAQSAQIKDFRVSYEKVQNQSRRLIELCDTFISNQRASFAEFLRESDGTLTTFKQLLRLSSIMVLGLAAALVILVYRGMIAPLRHQLTETHAIIARQEKLASLGVLAAGVAHEIRNPLTAIKFRLYSLRKSLPASGSGNEDADVIGNEIDRLERIVQDFLQFARPSEPDMVAAPVKRIVEEAFALLKPELQKASIELKLEPCDTAWIRADRQQIKQVLINLIQNAADSIERNGVITLRVRMEPGSARRGRADSVVVEVADNGKGIPPDVRKRLFDPFFTTKAGGTGLGLPIAARIVEKHGGALHYQTELHRGTTFSLVLPRVHEHET
jgi:signal transduction histidine kinase